MPEPIAVVYDGDCAFCTRSLRLLQRVDWRGIMRLYDSHAADVVAARFPMLNGADFDNAMFAVTADRRVFRGYFAFKELMRHLPLLWPLLLVCYIPGVDLMGPPAYAWVARNRRRFGCDGEVCEPPPSVDSTQTRSR